MIGRSPMPHGWRLPARSGRLAASACATDASSAIPPAIAGRVRRPHVPIDCRPPLERIHDPHGRASSRRCRLDDLRGRRRQTARAAGRASGSSCSACWSSQAALQHAIRSGARGRDDRGRRLDQVTVTPPCWSPARLPSAGLLLASAAAGIAACCCSWRRSRSRRARSRARSLIGLGGDGSGVLFRGVFPEAFVTRRRCGSLRSSSRAFSGFTRFDVWATGRGGVGAARASPLRQL